MPNSTALAPERPQDCEPSGSLALGIILAERIYAGRIVEGKLQRPVVAIPDDPLPADSEYDDSLVELHAEALIWAICDAIVKIAGSDGPVVEVIGVAVPGLLRNGIVEEAPNLPQLKGARMESMLAEALKARGIKAPVHIMNDADAMAAGLAAEHGRLDQVVRVWTLGTGIGYGRYPFAEGVWEGGHTTVTLDEKENYCGCGGRGHLEGIMGHRAMRLRFLDMEPEEVFEAANRRTNPDPRCVEFKRLWHRALAAATSTAIHVGGAGKFFITGYNVHFLDMNMLRQYLKEMVKMSSLQAYSLEVVPDDQSTRILGAAVAAAQMAVR